MSKVRVVIVPGNGSGDVEASNWYAWLRDELQTLQVDAVLRNMPDPVYARESNWLPFMKKELNCDNDTIIVGHSSGAAAAMRYAESNTIKGIVLVSAYTSDQDCEVERESGYFNRPWQWNKIKENTQFLVQFASTDDPFLPWEEQEEVAENLDVDLKKYTDKGHFMTFSFPDLLDNIKHHL